MEISDFAVKCSIPEINDVLRQHRVHDFEAALCEDSVLKRCIYSEAGVVAPSAVLHEVGEGRMYDLDHPPFVFGYDEDGPEMLEYMSGCPHGEAE